MSEKAPNAMSDVTDRGERGAAGSDTGGRAARRTSGRRGCQGDCVACGPCHGDVLLALANTPGMIALARLDLDRKIEAAYKALGRQRLALEILERERRRLG